MTQLEEKSLELKARFRKYKISILDGLDFKHSSKSISDNKGKLGFIYSNFKDDILSGSLALSIFGLLNRVPKDIDILIEDDKRYSSYIKSDYDELSVLENRLGKISFKSQERGFLNFFKSTEVDFFKNTKASYINLNIGDNRILKVHNPIEIIKYKMSISFDHNADTSTINKHIEDIEFIFNKSGN